MPRRLTLILVTGAILLAWAALRGPAAVQRRNIVAARSFAQAVRDALAADARFADVAIGTTTRPTVMAHGTVPDAAALRDLRARLAPPPGAPFGVDIDVDVASAGRAGNGD